MSTTNIRKAIRIERKANRVALYGQSIVMSDRLFAEIAALYVQSDDDTRAALTTLASRVLCDDASDLLALID